MIRPMEKADMEQILKLWVSCAKQAHPFLAPDWWNQYVEPIRENYTPAMDTAVFEKDGRVAGFIGVAEKRLLGALCVDPALQGQGIGTALLQHMAERFPGLWLWVYEQNENAVRFYTKRGFSLFGRAVNPATGKAELVLKAK